MEENQTTARNIYNISVNGDYQTFPEVKSITYSNTYNHYHYYGVTQEPALNDAHDMDAHDDYVQLAGFIPNKEARVAVVRAVKTCSKNRQVACLVEQILKEYGLWSSKLISREFAALLIGIAPFETNIEALYKAFCRN